ncbi:sigma factor-like helix-turn-helix DNA-binding protein [Streptomyces sp. NPDC057620]|uniref:sigma factor-like helix-turn-helix DNA-binding protein n=1 Tax=Streptomyces sp. NPDC057620 TaxID=3346185 RepID=UPI000D1A2E36
MTGSNKERNLAMVEAYAAGETLEQIGGRFSITRERVRQILKSMGAVTAEQARQVRAQGRAHELSEQVAAFLQDFRTTIEDLAAAGVARTEVEARFSLLLPQTPSTVVREAIGEAGVLFNVDVQEFAFSPAVIESAVWYALAREEGLTPDPVAAVAGVDVEEANDVALALQREGLDAETVSSILCLVHTARQHARENAGTGLSAQRYNGQRRQILSELGLESRKGSAPWPPTSQTVMKRIGHGAWGDALTGIGLTPDRRGRPKGLIVFDEEHYPAALNQYLEYCVTNSQTSTFTGYQTWVDAEDRAGRRHPSAAAVRFRYGNWISAKRAVAGSVVVQVAASRGQQTSTPAATLALHSAQQEIDMFLTRLERTPPTEMSGLVESFTRGFMQEFEFRRRGWIRAIVAADPTAIPRRLADPALKPKPRAAIVADGAGILTDMYIDKLGNGDPRITDGWLRADVQAELNAVPDEVLWRFTVLRETRNYLTHTSQEARLRLQTALETLAGANPQFTLGQSLTSRVVLSWLAAAQARRLKELLACVPTLWRAMVVGETLLTSPSPPTGA